MKNLLIFTQILCFTYENWQLTLIYYEYPPIHSYYIYRRSDIMPMSTIRQTDC